MKKKYVILLTLIALLFSSKSFALGGPDAYGYTWATSLDAGGPVYNWIDITSRPGVQTVTGLADDNSAISMIDVGFNFHFYWSDYSQLKVGSNGWMSFNNVSNIASCFPTIPTAGGAGDNLLSPFMSDLNFTGVGNPGQVKYWSNNTDSCVVSFINVPYWSVSAPGWTGSNSFQVILCASDSSITFQYGTVGNVLANAACVDMTVGIENSTGAVGLEVYSDVTPPSNFAIKFDYPSVVLMSIQDPISAWNNNSGNRAIFVPNTIPIALQADYSNAGNTAVTTTIDLQATILDAASTTLHTTTGTLPDLAAGEDTVFTFPLDWTPATTGQYTFRSTVTNAQDLNPGNNTKNTELDVVNICSTSMQLSYVSENTPSGAVNWNGGANDDGVAVYYAPIVYPYSVSAVEFYIASNLGATYIAQIYDDNGANGAPGTLLYDQTIPAGSIVSSAWNTVTLATPVTLNDGGFYVVWLQGGTTIFLGSETTEPFSRRNYEILDGGWGEYRDNETKDLCIRATIDNYSAAPASSFSATTDHLNGSFTNTSAGFYQSWSWDFGDGNTSTLENPMHTYAAPGTYTVCLITTTPCGSDTSCTVMTICTDANATHAVAIDLLTIEMINSSTDADAWFWDFGDGNTSTVENPTHTYAAPGTYTVCLIAYNSCGYNDTTCNAFMVCDPATANYSASTNQLTVNFTDLSTNSNTWAWDFGDGNTSTTQHPSHTFASAGTYTVCLIVTTMCGTADTICQNINACQNPTASFLAIDNELTVDFTNMSTLGMWAWDFGDGTTSVIFNPSHTYASAGTYTVCLITTDGCGADTICQNITVCQNPVAGFTFSNTNLSVDFTDLSTFAIDWAWDFGDGNTSTLQNPTHVFGADGTYTVCLMSTNACGDADTICQQVAVQTNGIVENTALDMNAYPNPTENIVHIAFASELQHAVIEVTDLIGKIVWSENDFSGTATQVDAAAWSAGFYKIRVIHESETGVLTFVKE